MTRGQTLVVPADAGDIVARGSLSLIACLPPTAMTAMQQVWITGPQQAEVRTVAPPVPGDGEVLVSMAFAGICGSDLHTLQRGHPWLPYPLAPGHEGSGVVIGDPTPPAGARRWAAGDRVYLRPVVACGECFYCGRGLPNLCAEPDRRRFAHRGVLRRRGQRSPGGARAGADRGRHWRRRR